MKTLIAFAIASGLIGAAAVMAADTKVKLQDLPPAVQKAVQEQTKNATLVGLAKEVENGKTLYEVETKVNGRGRDLIIDGSGAILEVEEEVALESIPAAARAAIEKAAAGGKIDKVETLTKGKTVAYEAGLTKNGKKSAVAVTADGAPVK